MAEPFRRRIRSTFLRAASQCAVRTPRPLLRTGLRCASWLSRYSVLEKRTHANLRLAFREELEPANIQAIANGVRAHTARLAEEWLQLAGRKSNIARWLEDRVEVDPSIEILREQYAKGRGVIVATAHIGNWELLAATLKRIGFEGSVVGLAKHRDSSADWLIKMRLNYGVTTHSQRSNPRKLLRVLQRGELIGLLSDLEVRRLAGQHVPFFGRPALTMTAPAALARASGLPLVPVRCVLPHPDAERYLLSVDEPLFLDQELPKQAAATDLLARQNQLFENWIRASPAQWAWHQDRWRSAPQAGQSVPLGGR